MTSQSAELAVVARHLSPHAMFGDDPSGYCGCADCEPRRGCGCRSCRETYRIPPVATEEADRG